MLVPGAELTKSWYESNIVTLAPSPSVRFSMLFIMPVWAADTRLMVPFNTKVSFPAPPSIFAGCSGDRSERTNVLSPLLPVTF